jgi:branched-subunit amino acid transport protein
MRAEVLLILLGMCLVTYVPRALPAALVDRLRFSWRLEKFLKLIPYTAMAALIFPGVLFVDAANLWIGIVGAAVAALLALLKSPVMVCVLAAIAADMLLYMIF